MQKEKLSVILILIIIIVIGLYIFIQGKINLSSLKIHEGLSNPDRTTAKCPNVLVRRGNKILMYNNTDRNYEIPIHFNNLDEYVEFVKKEQTQGKNCPILFLQEETDVQGNDVFRVRPSPFDLQGGMTPIEIKQKFGDVTAKMWNAYGYHSFDPNGQNIGIYTEMDAVHDSTEWKKISGNAMDTNWGGVDYTREQIEEGVYKDREVTKPTYFSPKGHFIPEPELGYTTPPKSFVNAVGTFVS